MARSLNPIASFAALLALLVGIAAPSGADSAPLFGAPPVAGATDVICTDNYVGALGDIFGAGLMAPRWQSNEHLATTWDTSFLETTRAVAANHGSTLRASGIKFNVRFGHQPVDGITLENGSIADGYHWQQALDPASGQMNIDQYIEYTRSIGGEPQVVINIGTGTAAEAASLVAYSNGTDPSDPAVALRISRGHPAPYGIKIWELGNEQYGPWAAGNKGYVDGPRGRGSSSPTVFGERASSFANAMRPKSGVPVTILAPLNDWELGYYGEESGTRQLVAATSASVDGYVIHFYPESGVEPVLPERMLGAPELFEGYLNRARSWIDAESHGKHLDLAVTEWSASAYGDETGRKWINGLFVVDTLVAMSHAGISLSNYFSIAAPAGDPGSYSYWKDNDPSAPAPALIATEVAARHFGPSLLETEVRDAPMAASHARHTGDYSYHQISALCSFGPPQRVGASAPAEHYLVLVNKSAEARPVNVTAPVASSEPIPMTVLTAAPFDETVKTVDSSLESTNRFSLEIPAWSAAFLTFPAARAA